MALVPLRDEGVLAVSTFFRELPTLDKRSGPIFDTTCCFDPSCDPL
jgi:hypothetical protein